MLRQRIWTALVLIALVLFMAILAPTWVFAGFLLFVVVLAGYEWAGLSGWAAQKAGVYAVALAVVWFALVTLPFADGHGALLLMLISAFCWLLVAVALAFYHPGWGRWSGWGWLVRLAGVVTLLPSAAALLWLHAMGTIWLLAPMALVAAADSGGYFVGRRFGRTPLAPEISPGKTREGVLGAGFAVVVMAAALAVLLDLDSWSALQFLLLGMVVGLWSISGDLFESLLKREHGSKDSGALLPGHGGVLDRIDSLLVAAPMFLLGVLLLEHWGSLSP